MNDARALGLKLVARLKKMPLYVFLAAGTLVMVVAVMAVVGLSGQRYAVLFDGLSPARGGHVIAALQKEGIPYRLSQDGNVISVPAPDLGRARLQLGVDGQPQSESDASWKALEQASVTTSEAATRAMHMQAVERSLQDTILTMSGARRVQVLLAEPRSTPFLADQPKPKASVVLTGAPQADTALGMAVAKLVAGAVPGLSEDSVVVATGHGTIIYPVSSAGDVAQQLAIVKRIEAAQEAKIRTLLIPILGAGNARVSVSADVSFGQKQVHRVSYGPNAVADAIKMSSEKRVGADPGPKGIPGALSNQPPGPTTAPVTPPAAGTKAQGLPPAGLPQSETRQSQKRYLVDKTTSVEHPAEWAVKKISVSVVVNKAALGSLSISELKTMVGSTITVPTGHVDVTSATFVTNGSALAGSPRAQMSQTVKAALLLVAALGFLFGVILPLIRWLRQAGARIPVAPPRPRTPVAEFEEQLESANLKTISGQIAEVGLERPEALAAVLQRWLKFDESGPQTEEAG